MGDRLVQVIRYKGKFLAASYNHWSAEDAEDFSETLDDIIYEHGLFNSDKKATTGLAVQCLIESIEKVYNSIGDGGLHKAEYAIYDKGLWKDYYSDVQEAFIKEHPEIPIGNNRNDGLITVDEKISNDWLGFAEAVNNFDWE